MAPELDKMGSDKILPDKKYHLCTFLLFRFTETMLQLQNIIVNMLS